VTFVALGIRTFDRMRREHALLLTCVCAALLLFNLPYAQFGGSALTFLSNNSDQNESEVDTALQEAATSALAGREGTVIIMDAQTGRVRAIVNVEEAYAQAVMPGSAIKPFTALAALRAGFIDEDSRTACPGRFTGLSFSLPCVHADHLPPFSPSQAIAYSCNYYFATLGQRLGRDRLVSTLHEFNFAQPTGIATGENAGLVRPCESGNQARVAESNHVSEEADCAAREGIGESNHIQVTPIQLLTAYTALVNGGHLYQPQIGRAENFNAVERSEIHIAAVHRAIITEGMAGAVRYGTARSAGLDRLPLTILGKTGTANPPKGFRTNGWFIGFAGAFQSNRPLDSSEVKLAVLVLLARAHGSQAAEVARPIFETYANVVSHRDTEAQSRNESSGIEVDADSIAAYPRLPLSASATIKVHLVHDNITQELSLEDYVLGVMRAEGTMEDQPEALKALAIAIRTYALKNIGRHAKDGYDFCSTTHCQRFVGDPTVREGAFVRPDASTLPNGRVSALVAAVRATEGQILVDDRDQPIDSYFGASCGGETANIGELWGVTPPAYLRGVRDEYCDAGPHAKWVDTISRADLLRALRSDTRTDVGNRLDQVVVNRRDETGRAEFIALDGEQHKVVRGWDFKIIVGRVLGWNVLKSSRFEVARSGANFVFRGSGFGHGLGLCQEGAHVMAERGTSFQKILDKYFPGTSLKKDGGKGRQGQAETEKRRRGDTANQNGKEIWNADLLWRNRADPSIYASPNLRFSPSRFLTISSEHFRVTYPADVGRHDADQVLNTLESARADYVRRASAASIAVNMPTLEIRLNESTGDFTARTGQPWWAAAATKGNRIELQPLALLKKRGVLFTSLRHELAHVAIDSIGNRAPRWLEEGFALYLAGEGPAISRYQKRGLLLEEELERRMQHPGTQEEMRSLYAQAYATVAEMVRNQGEASVWKKMAGG
jgi:stage II sporulation protein D